MGLLSANRSGSAPVVVAAAKTATVPTAKTTPTHAGEAATMPTAETAVVPAREASTAPAAEVARVPRAETATAPAAEAPPVPCVGPMGCGPAPMHSGKSDPGMAKMSDRRTRSDSREAAIHVTTVPPFGADRREGQDRRTDKEREGGRAENDEGWCHCNDDFGRR